MALGTLVAGPAAGGAFWNDQRFRGIFAQAVVMGLLGLLLYFVIANTITNLEKRNIATGFWFLSQPAGYELSMKLIPYSSEDSHARVYLVGLLNTLFISVLGCLFATIIGFVLGVLRLSGNWLLDKVIYWFVEFSRNVPLLLWIIFWSAVSRLLPRINNSIEVTDNMYLNIRGLFTPVPVLGEGFDFVLLGLAAGLAGAWAIARWSRKRQAATGKTFPAFWAGLLVAVLIPTAVFYAAGQPMEWQAPVRNRFNLQGGLQIAPEFVAMLLALTLYTAAFISEIVRSGILSVQKGQREAAAALGLKPNWTMRLIIVPQALRVIIPPLASQYMNLTKNSSLGFAIGFSELMATTGGISLNQTGQAIECMAIVMVTYLIISLSISAFMNWYNARVKLVER